MKRIHNLKRTIALFLAMLMAATSTAFADWDSFQGNDDNNGTTDIGITSRAPSTTTVNLPNDGATTGLDVEPLIVGSRIYAFHNGGSNGATVTAVSATNGSQLWTKVVGPEAKNVSQVATPVISEDGKTMYGVYTYGHDTKATGFEDLSIPVDGSATRNFTFTLPCAYNNLQISTGLANTGWVVGDLKTSLSATATIKNSRGDTVTTLTGTSYQNQGFSLYYGDYSGGPIPAGTYTVEMTVTNNTANSVTWTNAGTQVLVNYWSLFQLTDIDTGNPTYTRLSNEPATGTDVGHGQPASPLTLANGNVYFGIYDGDVAYFQYNIAGKNFNKFVPGNNNSFYSAGAVVIGDKVIFGSESGTLYMRSANSFANAEKPEEDTGKSLILPDAGKIHSSICFDSNENENYLYLTSDNGLLWKIKFTGSDFGSPSVMSIAQGTVKNSSSTPVVSKSGLIYVSVYGYNSSFVGEGYVVATSRSSFGTVNRIYSGDIVQCSPVVYTTSDNTDYVYFTTNVPDGTGFCYQCQYVSFSASPLWSYTPASEGNGYAVQGFAMGSYRAVGRLTNFGAFGNDNNQIVIVKG